MLYAIIAVVFLMIGFLAGIYYDRHCLRKIGTLFVDPLDNEGKGSVYTVFDISPISLHDGQIVEMDVMIANLSNHMSQ